MTNNIKNQILQITITNFYIKYTCECLFLLPEKDHTNWMSYRRMSDP